MNITTSGLLAGLLLALPLTARAEEREIAASLTLDQTVAAALADNAQLRAMRLKAEAMAERPAQARTPANPMFTYGGMDDTSRGQWPNTGEKRFMVEQTFPWFGKLGLKGKIAGKEAETMQREYEVMQREVVLMVKENYFDLYGVQQAISITRAEEDVLKRIAQAAEIMYTNGERSQQDVIKAQTEITMLQQKLLELGTQEATLKAKLNQLLNRRADAQLGLTVTAPKDKLVIAPEQLFALAEKNRAEIKGAQAQIERNEAERRLMKKEFWPDYRLGIEYRNFRSSMDPDMVMFTIGFDLPIWHSKYKAGVREAEKMIESSRAAREAAARSAAFDVQDAWFKLQTARRTLELYNKTLIPQAERRFQASEASYRTGKVDFMDLLESQRFLLSARVMSAMAESNLGLQQARLEYAVGTDLPKEQL